MSQVKRLQSDLPFVLMRHGSGMLHFRTPVRILCAHRLAEVEPVLRAVEVATQKEGGCAAGWIAYEAAPAFDAALKVKSTSHFPLLWFGIFREAVETVLPVVENDLDTLDWRPSITADEYRRAVEIIRGHIRNGASYQVNFSYRLKAAAPRDPFAYFVNMAGDRAPFGAYIETEEWAVCSASPELFFKLEGERIESRPMKGTAARGLWFEQDHTFKRELRDSIKDRAENVMIVDMVRNDLGRIAEVGSVRPVSLFDIEKYPTVWQMTSTIAARSRAPLFEILQALFPAASITGAPKCRTMEIIADLETTPRNLYTGAVGFVLPKRIAQFNVAIRTMVVDKVKGCAEYGVGGGIVWDSRPAAELMESRTKAAVLSPYPRRFELVETMLRRDDGSVWLLEEHLLRLAKSADYFDFKFDEQLVRKALAEAIASLPAGLHRLRLTLARDGLFDLQAQAIETEMLTFGRLTLAAEPIDPKDRFLYHKTTFRAPYERALKNRPGFDAVLLFNEAGEITETTIANVAVEIDGRLCTPPVECGLLPGTLRAHLLHEKVLTERVITVEQAVASGKVYLLNSVRGVQRAVLEMP